MVDRSRGQFRDHRHLPLELVAVDTGNNKINELGIDTCCQKLFSAFALFTGTVTKVLTLESSWLYTIRFPKTFRKYLIYVGSISVDGTSLTVARLGRTELTVAIIPYTYTNTIFHNYKVGTKVNLEFDVIGKYIESIVQYGK